VSYSKELVLCNTNLELCWGVTGPLLIVSIGACTQARLG